MKIKASQIGLILGLLLIVLGVIITGFSFITATELIGAILGIGFGVAVLIVGIILMYLSYVFGKKHKITRNQFTVALVIAVASDVADILLFFIFQLPIVGNLLDLVTFGIISYILKEELTIISLGEQLPGLGNALPLNTLAVLAAYGQNKLGL